MVLINKIDTLWKQFEEMIKLGYAVNCNLFYVWTLSYCSGIQILTDDPQRPKHKYLSRSWKYFFTVILFTLPKVVEVYNCNVWYSKSLPARFVCSVCFALFRTRIYLGYFSCFTLFGKTSFYWNAQRFTLNFFGLFWWVLQADLRTLHTDFLSQISAAMLTRLFYRKTQRFLPLNLLRMQSSIDLGSTGVTLD